MFFLDPCSSTRNDKSCTRKENLVVKTQYPVVHTQNPLRSFKNLMRKIKHLLSPIKHLNDEDIRNNVILDIQPISIDTSLIKPTILLCQVHPSLVISKPSLV